jgi:uncharacterized repeat protein (TIGR01451 family)
MNHRRYQAAAHFPVLIFLIMSVHTADARTIGPDAFGYIGTDQVAISWDEIAPEEGGPGTAIASLTGTDDKYAAIPIGFGFRFYGTRYTSVFVSVNGLLSFNSNGLSTSFITDAIPTSTPPNNLIAPFWDDLSLWPTQNVYYAVLGTEPYRRLVVQFYGASHFDDPNARYHFQVILYETWNQVRMQYRDMRNGPDKFLGDGRQATLGIEDAGGANGLQWSRNEIRSVLNGMCVVFSPPVAADLRIAKEASPDPAYFNSELVYTLVVSNAGPDAATEVRVQDTLPSSVIFTSAETSQGNAYYSNGVLTCMLGTIEENAFATITLRVQVMEAGVLTNTASVLALQTDPDPSNNSASKVVTVITHAELSVEGQPSPIGASSPYDYGSHTVLVNTPLTNEATSPIDPGTGTRIVCIGWSGPGLTPTEGSGAEAVFHIMQPATQTWHWITEHYLSITSQNGAVLGAAEGWKPSGYIYDLVPASAPDHYFSHWVVNDAYAGSNVPLKITMEAPWQVVAVFSSSLMNVTGQTSTELFSWRHDPSTGTFFANLRLCNLPGSPLRLGRPFWYAVQPTANYYLMHPDGTNELDGLPYVDITAQVEAALATTGNGDLVLDPGECVVVSDIEFYLNKPSPFTGVVYASWADAPEDEDYDEQNADTDGDGFTNIQEQRANTNPHDPGCYLRVVGAELINGKLRLTWYGGTNVAQHIASTGQVDQPDTWTSAQTNTPPMPRTNTAEIEPNDPRRFFRILVP